MSDRISVHIYLPTIYLPNRFVIFLFTCSQLTAKHHATPRILCWYVVDP